MTENSASHNVKIDSCLIYSGCLRHLLIVEAGHPFSGVGWPFLPIPSWPPSIDS